MSRIKKIFSILKKQNKKALIPFITAGYPQREMTVPLMHALVKGGADIIELGIPFSDPMADGPIIQRASECAIKNGINLKDVFHFVREFRKKDFDTPVVLMGYANPVERMGMSSFVQEAASSGVDGVLIVDYPLEESADFMKLMKLHKMDLIFLLAPTSSEERIKKIGQHATGYIYYVSLKGVTGSANLNLNAVSTVMPLIKKYVRVPISIGFGIRDEKTAKAAGAFADGVIIGSQLIQVIENAEKNQEERAAEMFISRFRRALDE